MAAMFHVLELILSFMGAEAMSLERTSLTETDSEKRGTHLTRGLMIQRAVIHSTVVIVATLTVNGVPVVYSHDEMRSAALLRCGGGSGRGGVFIRLMAALTCDIAVLGRWVFTKTFTQRGVKLKVHICIFNLMGWGG